MRCVFACNINDSLNGFGKEKQIHIDSEESKNKTKIEREEEEKEEKKNTTRHPSSLRGIWM